jgi:hypothetical protein
MPMSAITRDRSGLVLVLSGEEVFRLLDRSGKGLREGD